MPTKPVDKEEDTASPALPAYQLPGREMDVRIRNAPQGLDGFGQRARYSVHVCVGASLLSDASRPTGDGHADPECTAGIGWFGAKG